MSPDLEVETGAVEPTPSPPPPPQTATGATATRAQRAELDHYNRHQAGMEEVELEIGESDSELNPE